MMIRDKIICCARPTLFVVFSILLGCVGTSEAQVILSDSIRDILSTEQIEALQVNATVQTLKMEMRDENRKATSEGVIRNTSTGTESKRALMVDLMDHVEDTVGSEVENIFMQYTKIENQKKKLSVADDPDGLAILFAPSNTELGLLPEPPEPPPEEPEI